MPEYSPVLYESLLAADGEYDRYKYMMPGRVFGLLDWRIATCTLYYTIQSCSKVFLENSKTDYTLLESSSS